MKAFIISVGDEVLCGDVVNTNAAYIAKELDAMGIETLMHLVTADKAETVGLAFESAAKTAELIITTGGLGPTKDDLTKEAVCEKLGVKLVCLTQAAEAMKARFASRNMKFTENNLKQYMIPEGSIALENKNGTAPGVFLQKDGVTAVMLPGPPNELIPMFEQSVKPLLAHITGREYYEKYYMTSGAGESALEADLRENIEPKSGYTLNTYLTDSGIMIKAVAHAENETAAKAAVESCDAKIKELLGDTLYSEQKEELWQCVGRKLIQSGLTITTAESCTGGMLSKRLTEVAGISAVFKGGCVCYSEEIKHKIVGVKTETLEKYTAVSEQTARELASGIRERFSSDIGIGITGYAGPGAGQRGESAGLVYIGVDFMGGVTVEKNIFSGGRERVRAKATAEALRILNKMINSYLDKK